MDEGKATGWPILLLTRNSDVKSSNYSFLPDHRRPGHADMVEGIRSNGANDPRGGGSQSARLTFGLVAAGSQAKTLLEGAGWTCSAHLHSLGEVRARPLFELDRNGQLDLSTDMGRLNCRDPEAAVRMSEHLDSVRKERDAVGSSVDLLIEALPIRVGRPWVDGSARPLAGGLRTTSGHARGGVGPAYGAPLAPSTSQSAPRGTCTLDALPPLILTTPPRRDGTRSIS